MLRPVALLVRHALLRIWRDSAAFCKAVGMTCPTVLNADVTHSVAAHVLTSSAVVAMCIATPLIRVEMPIKREAEKIKNLRENLVRNVTANCTVCS